MGTSLKKTVLHHPVLNLTLQLPATLLKVSVLHGYFSRFSNCTNGNTLRKASNMNTY